MACKSSVFVGTTESRKKWTNWNGDVAFRASEYFVPAHSSSTGAPDGLQQLVHVVARATREKRRLHAIGSGWAFENIAASDSWVVSLRDLSRRLDNVVGPASPALTADWRARQLAAGNRLVHVEAGIELGALIEMLDADGLALPTLGGSNGQSLAGAISTSTHGGDWEQPPLPEIVRAIHLVTDGGRELWIERASAPITTDLLASVLPCPETEIVRDDDVFNSAVVSFGRFGVIYSFVLEVRPAFRVVEVVTRPSRARVLQALRDGQASGPLFGPLFTLLAEDPAPANLAERDFEIRTDMPYFLQVLFNSQNPEDCWAHRRWETPEIADLPPKPTTTTVTAEPVLDGQSVLNYAAAILVATAGVAAATVPVAGSVYATALLALAADMELRSVGQPVTVGSAAAMVLSAAWKLPWLGNAIPEISHMVISSTARLDQAIAKGRRGPHHLLTSGPRASGGGLDFRSDSIEVVFDATTAGYLDFLDAILAAAPAFKQCGAISVRPSLPSRAELSMHNVPGSHAVSIEVAVLKHLDDNAAWIRFVEDTALVFGGRPHWGQINRLDEPQVRALYGARFLKWREALERVSRNSRLFSNRFTRRRGLEPRGIMREVSGIVREQRLKMPPGRVTHLLGDGPWSPVRVSQAVDDIESGAVAYFIGGGGRERVLHVANRSGRKYLRTGPDGVGDNNLGTL